MDARALVPKLDDLGFRVIEEGPEPGVPAPVVSAAAIYRSEDLLKQVQVRTRVMPDEDAARQEFGVLSEALRNPPKEFLGIEAKFVDTASPQIADERKSYKTEAADGRGYSAWTDLYRQGRTVIILQVVDNTSDGLPLRQQVGERAVGAAP